PQDEARRYGADPHAEARRYGAEPQDKTQRYGAEPQDKTQRYGADLQDEARRYGAEPHAEARRYGAEPHAEARRYGAALRSEWRQFGDILQGSFWDTYANLTQKTLLLLGWAALFCPAAQFVLKADDDSFIHTPALLAHLQSPPSPLYYMGRVHYGVAPNRDPRSRHHVPVGLYPLPSFPPYCSGSAYVLSMAALRGVLRVAPSVPKVSPEDVFIGLCAHRAGIPPTHVERMGGGARFPEDGCCFGEVLLSAHRMGPDGMRRAWGHVVG
ncbi:beta-1,3-galactosyltransferase 4-like, partial [Phasianus colchicus]|uniref:beta-1,3-galactosyltransferase 4-like n=1 Tax=Phasianus colchicus TaxID=9054 RepID=UPI00129EF345